MAVRRLIVWTVVAAPLEGLAAAMTDARALSSSLGRGYAWSAVEPDALTAAWRTASMGRFDVRIGAGPWSRHVVTEVLDGVPGFRVTTRCEVPGVVSWVHRRRLERAIGGKVRMVDEVVLVAGPLVIAVWTPLARRLLVRLHHSIVAAVGGVADGPTAARVYVLSDANAAHAEDALAGGPEVHS